MKGRGGEEGKGEKWEKTHDARRKTNGINERGRGEEEKRRMGDSSWLIARSLG